MLDRHSIAKSLAPKLVQARMGHASITLTMDLYGHLWADAEADQAAALVAEQAILGKPRAS
jgi:integrase